MLGQAAAWVYPRVCGGTRCQRRACRTILGLSPRVRGNRAKICAGRLLRGSIPACAGEPSGTRAELFCARVYPRVCGGTPAYQQPPSGQRGLSPRVRGNRLSVCLACGWNGSIPACAGEPMDNSRCPESRAVYPRVCGGTGCAPSGVAIPAGLSPRVRGNLGMIGTAQARRRSIPACAGEPVPLRTQLAAREVYPRVCGGTDNGIIASCGSTGLSPRVRGNPSQWFP